MRLGQLTEGVTITGMNGDPDVEINGIVYDSRRVRPGYLFVAIKGHALDGHAFIDQAIQNGASAIVAETLRTGPGPTFVRVADSHEALSALAVAYFRNPCDGMDLIGITGTNGKTTTSYLLESILLAAGHRPGVLGTVTYRYPGHVYPAPVTTPESLDLMEAFRKMADLGVTHVVLEVSSHGLEQGRVRHCPFRVAVFTNLSRDHLDYHGSMDAYFEAKSRLFCDLAKRAARQKLNRPHAVINLDDPMAGELMALTDAEILTYGLHEASHVRADRVKLSRNGISARITAPKGPFEVRSNLIGGYNLSNILAAAAAALSLDIEPETIAAGVARLHGVPGRLEMVKNPRGLAVAVDYAHTPDALMKALGAVRPLTNGKLITVFGCGGDRDKGKRSEMGRVASQASDVVFITSDNPRTEDPGAIVAQIEKGVVESGMKKLAIEDGHASAQPRGYRVELDRASAIRKAVGMATAHDLILIAGKGHEDYQIIGREKRPFDDRVIAREAASEEL
jgi:UDP-N-acetylmuramoyl-L-alanyl-D-glutamate--2,6-diaminopimelate ligase